MDKWLVNRTPTLYPSELLVMFDDCACKRGRRWLLLGFLCFFAFTLLSFSHDRSPCGDYMLKYAATNVMRFKDVSPPFGQPEIR